MGKPTGFLEYERKTAKTEEVSSRIQHFNEFHTHLPLEKQKLQGARCMSCGVPFCQSGVTLGGMTSGCPLHNLIPEWNDLVYFENWEQAYLRLRKTNNFPEFTARVCPALCEASCTCSLNGDAVATKENEYVIVEQAYKMGWAKENPPRVRTGKKVAVIGSGPAGLSAADQLNQRGHYVTVFERSNKVGGLLRYGIPNMKLEKEVIDRRIAIMQAEGITFVTGADVGNNYKATSILKEFDAVILACGSSNPRDIKVKGREAKGIYFAVDFLTGVTKSLKDSNFKDKNYVEVKDKQVVVIGGGDTGNDCVGTSIRLGAKNVIQLEMMPKAPEERKEDNPWPQWPKVSKVDYGQEEAIVVYGKDPRVYQTTVTEFISNKKGELTHVKTVCLESKWDDKTKRLQMLPMEGTEKLYPAEVVLIAAGFLGSEEYVAKAFKVELDARTNVKTREHSFETSVSNVFVAGDMHIGQSLVVKAIRQGREVAEEVDRNLMGYTNLREQ